MHRARSADTIPYVTRQTQVVSGIVFVLVAGMAGLLLLNRAERKGPDPAPAREAVAPSAATPRPVAPPQPETAPEAPRRRTEVVPPPAPEPVAPAAEAVPDTGTLNISSDVSGAQVFIDREYVGTTPLAAQNVKPGTHRLNLSVEGYDGIIETIDVEPGTRDITIRFREVRLDASVAVVHKHGIGSCKGLLVATPKGLRYETSHKDDAFSAGLLDLEAFQVDYLEKNLKVKARKGKQYNFTDPEGNADRLFVFHRDVEKARDRLKKGDVPAGD